MPGIAYGKPVEHVLLLSIDGFHDFDLTNYVATHRTSALALLVARGTVYEQAWSPAPSDSFPATLAMVTGGSRLIPVRPSRTSDATKLPLDPDAGCVPVYPHQYLRVNTIYEVAHAAGMRTAVSDKHPSYEILFGPYGTGIDDFYSPEFNGAKKDLVKIQQNDELRVQAVLHQLDGLDHTGRSRPRSPRRSASSRTRSTRFASSIRTGCCAPTTTATRTPTQDD